MNRKEEQEDKVLSLTEWMERRGYAGVLFTTQANFSWITCGGEAHVSLAAENAAGCVLVTSGRIFLLTNVIEERRLLDEELRGLGMEAVTWPWHAREGLRQACAGLANPARIVADDSGLSPFLYDAELMDFRRTLRPSEAERYRQLGRDGADVVEGACRRITPGSTEREIAGIVAEACWERGILPLVNLVAADERIRSYRHPIPTMNRVRKIGMVALTGRRGGFHVSLTRLVAFSRVDEETRRRHRAVTSVDAAYLFGSRPGRALNEVLRDGVERYESTGFHGEWEHHHQGGLTGYAGREIFATPWASYKLRCNQCVAWNPSITGTKSEDPAWIGEDGQEIFSYGGTWPTLEVSESGGRVLRPDILVR